MGAIILFDGECHFCHQSVQFIIKRDKNAYFSFASLKSEIGQKLLKRYDVSEKLNRLIVIETMYQFIANNRYKWFGKKKTCIVPKPEVRKRFL